LTLQQISAFEDEIGGRLPEDYKHFLLAHNGGVCEPLLGLPWTGGLEKVGWFLALYSDDYHGIRNSLRHLRELNAEIGSQYLPIAATLSECDICLACRRNHFGAAYFTAYKYKIAYRHDLVPIDVTMVPLANSFTELIEYLEEIPDPHCPVEHLGKEGTADDLQRYLAEGHSIDSVSKNKLTILCEAIRFNNLSIINACIEHGANMSGSIKMAVQSGQTEPLEFLVKAGANINERDEFGDTPLYYVCGTALPGREGQRNRQMRDLLVKLGAVEG